MKGKAAVYSQVGSPFEIKEFPLPEVEPDAVLVKVTLANICGSDLHIWRGEFPGPKLPGVMGHEMVGTVYELGKNIGTDSIGQPLAVGDRVVYPYWKTCGRCFACISGDFGACPNKFPFRTGGTVDEPPHFLGAYAEYYYVSPGQPIFKVPDEVSDEMAAPANCALAQVLFGLSRVGVRVGDYVVIQGAGGLGINSVAVAREMGASKIIVIDRLKPRLEMAEAFGADHTISLEEYPDSRERIGKIRELTAGRSADVVVEVAGVPQVIPEGVSMLRFGGRYLIMGSINMGQNTEISPASLIMRNSRLVFVGFYEPWAIVRALDLLSRTRGKYPFDRILSHKFKLSDINEAFKQADAGKVIRASLVP